LSSSQCKYAPTSRWHLASGFTMVTQRRRIAHLSVKRERDKCAV